MWVFVFLNVQYAIKINKIQKNPHNPLTIQAGRHTHINDQKNKHSM